MRGPLNQSDHGTLCPAAVVAFHWPRDLDAGAHESESVGCALTGNLSLFFFIKLAGV